MAAPAPDLARLRLVLGLKLRALRQGQGLTLQEVAARAGLAVSYLSEIEKGRKYPHPGKLLELARALGVAYDELVSPTVDEAIVPLDAVAESGFLQAFPFHVFGVDPQDLVGLVAGDPKGAGAMLRAFAEVAGRYDLEVEHFLFAALRAWQRLSGNYFPDLERAADALRAEEGWDPARRVSADAIEACLVRRHGYRVERDGLDGRPALADLRSVYADGPPPTLWLNGRLLPGQRAFVLARELGYRRLALTPRASTSSWVKVESFAQLQHNFMASYFAGALLIPEAVLVEEAGALLAARRFKPEILAALLKRYTATPEMLFYRLTQILPGRLGLPEIFFARFHRDAGARAPRLTKVLNLSRLSVPHGVGTREHTCRRWIGLTLLDAPALEAPDQPPPIAAEAGHFVREQAEVVMIAAARRLALKAGARSSVTLGLRLDDRTRGTIRFADDPSLGRREVDLSCERCPLTPAECDERAAPPSLLQRERDLARREAAIDALTATAAPPPRSRRRRPAKPRSGG